MEKKESDQKKRIVIDHSKKPNLNPSPIHKKINEKDKEVAEEYKLAALCKQLDRKVENDKPEKLSHLKNNVNIEKKDIKDYYNAHKMMVELYKIDNDEEDSIKGEDNIEELKKNIDIKPQVSENYLENNRYEEETNVSNKKDDLDETDHSKFDELRASLEKLIGDKMFTYAYKIVNDLIPENSITYDHEKISLAFIKTKGFDKDKILLCIEKIPELYSLVIKEREVRWKNKK